MDRGVDLRAPVGRALVGSTQVGQDRRGAQRELSYVGSRAMVVYDLPLNEVVFDFYDRLKSISRGYASFDYHQIGHREGDLVKMSILVNNEAVDALSMIVHRGNAEARGRGMCERLKDLIPRHVPLDDVQSRFSDGTVEAWRERVALLPGDEGARVGAAVHSVRAVPRDTVVATEALIDAPLRRLRLAVV